MGKKAAERKERLPEDLSVEIVEHTLPEEERICPECGEILRVIGKTERDTLVIIPATAKAEMFGTTTPLAFNIISQFNYCS